MAFDMRLTREPASYPADYEPQDDDKPASYRFAGGTMGVALAIMAASEVIDEEQASPSLPNWPPSGISAQCGRQIEQYMGDPQRLREKLTPEEWGLYEAYQRELDKVTAVGPTAPGKVPAFKFHSNDGWLISSAECRTIADGLAGLLRDGHSALFEWLEQEQGYSAEDTRELIRLWGGYNRLAAECGGYRVW